MKKIIGLAVIFLTLQGCTPAYDGHFVIVNNSGKDIEISSYEVDYINISHGVKFKKKFAIANNNKDEKILHGNGGDAPPSFLSYIEGDSISIDYGDKVQGYCFYINGNMARNPFRLATLGYFVYTLTPEDYANAIPKQ